MARVRQPLGAGWVVGRRGGWLVLTQLSSWLSSTSASACENFSASRAATARSELCTVSHSGVQRGFRSTPGAPAKTMLPPPVTILRDMLALPTWTAGLPLWSEAFTKDMMGFERGLCAR